MTCKTNLHKHVETEDNLEEVIDDHKLLQLHGLSSFHVPGAPNLENGNNPFHIEQKWASTKLMEQFKSYRNYNLR